MTNSAFLSANLQSQPLENRFRFWLAFWFMQIFHFGQKRRSGSPYAKHPMRVADKLAEFGTNCQIAAMFHDILEGLSWITKPLAMILIIVIFGFRVFRIVFALTNWHDDDEKYNNQMSKAIRAGLWEVLVIKIADKEDILNEPYNKSVEKELDYVEKVQRSFIPFTEEVLEWIPYIYFQHVQNKAQGFDMLCELKIKNLKEKIQPTI